MSQTRRPWLMYGHVSDMNKSVHTPADLGRFIYSVTDQLTLAGPWTKRIVKFCGSKSKVRKVMITFNSNRMRVFYKLLSDSMPIKLFLLLHLV